MIYKKTIVIAFTAAILLTSTLTFLPSSPDQDHLKAVSEKSRLMDAPQGHPDLFFQHLYDIRADENGIVDYPMGSVPQNSRRLWLGRKTLLQRSTG